MRLYLFLALILVVVGFLLYLDYRKHRNSKQSLQYLAALGMVIFFTYTSRILFVHKPIFIIHLALLVGAWIALFYYLIKKRLLLWLLLAPSITVIFFILEALFFREHG